ncbi:MAG: beta-propeller domain-containing protein [Bifidobacteriaceae bacterium]|jgi:uncharacterized secreted protein with C-terminal beta-propeller domain|nr:beta-propeller domain-containing protein [Bifidobacteriaceae bacterium]
MSDQEFFQAMRDQMHPAPEVRQALDQAIAQASGTAGTAADGAPAVPGMPVADGTSSQPGQPVPAAPMPAVTAKPRRTARLFGLAAGIAAVALAAGGVGYGIGHQGQGETTAGPAAGQTGRAGGTGSAGQPGGTGSDTTTGGDEEGAATGSGVATAGDYQAVYDALEKAGGGSLNGQYGGADRGDSVAVTEAASADTAGVKALPATGPGGDYSETNVQVEGIDEGDIVKTDGRAIYIASNKQVVIVNPDGANTTKLGGLDTAVDSPGSAEDLVAGRIVLPGQVFDLMLVDHYLVALVNEYTAEASGLSEWGGGASMYFDSARTKALVYDVTDPADATYVTEYAQSGSYLASRLQGNILYLVSYYPIGSGYRPVVAEDTRTYVPYVWNGTEATAVAADAIMIPADGADAAAYSVATAIDIAGGTVLGEASVMGGQGTVYMSQDNLYLAITQWDYNWDTTAETRASSVGDGMVLMQGQATTKLARIALNGGALQVAAEGEITGTLLNQFALDEYDGYLRLATTESVAEQGEPTDWSSDNAITRVSLLVLDGNFQVVGSIPQLIQNESIQAVRFTGAVGYVVTFLRTDPLFTLDLSDPTAPSIMSELEIPGFSAYLHPWADGELLGVGQAGELSSDGLKLSMFNTSDPFNVTELATIPFDMYHSLAMDDHKAVWADVDRGLIGLSAYQYSEDWSELTYHYLVFSYADGEFAQVADLAVPYDSAAQWNMDSIRGVQIGDALYVCTDHSVDAYTLDGFAKLGGISL